MKLYLLILTILTFSCNTSTATEREIKSTADTSQNNVSETANKHTELIEIFVDSLNIGKKGKNKIELIKHRVFNDYYVIVRFYTKWSTVAPWRIQNTYIYECNTNLFDLNPDIADYNNDGFKDLTFISAQAARISNKVRRLFIYDDYKNELISIVNSQDYPNLRYNKELNCIDAFLIHGGSSTVFAKIEGDSLIEFASVHNDSHRTVYEIDKFGKEKLLSKEEIDPSDVHIRYIHYKPLKEYNCPQDCLE